MDLWAEIRRCVLIDGESKRSVQRRYGLHWKTLQKIHRQPEPAGYQQSRPRAKKKLGPFLPVIEVILQQDRQAPPKQRHTAKRIFERLRAEYGYTGGLTVVKDAVRARRAQHSEVFVPLRHPPGEAQTDFGQAEITLAGVPTKAALFVISLPYSDALFCCAFPRECTEAFLEGHRRAFDFFGGVLRRISYDNSKIAVAKVWAAAPGSDARVPAAAEPLPVRGALLPGAPRQREGARRGAGWSRRARCLQKRAPRGSAPPPGRPSPAGRSPRPARTGRP
jgi:transposase